MPAGGSGSGFDFVGTSRRTIWFTSARCRVIVDGICVNMSAVSVTSTSVLSDGWMPRLNALRMGGMPWRMFISMGTASDTCAPASFTFCHAMSDIPVMWMNRLSERNCPVDARVSKVPRMKNGATIWAAIMRPSSRPIAQAASKPGR